MPPAERAVEPSPSRAELEPVGLGQSPQGRDPPAGYAERREGMDFAQFGQWMGFQHQAKLTLGHGSFAAGDAGLLDEGELPAAAAREAEEAGLITPLALPLVQQPARADDGARASRNYVGVPSLTPLFHTLKGRISIEARRYCAIQTPISPPFAIDCKRMPPIRASVVLSQKWAGHGDYPILFINRKTTARQGIANTNRAGGPCKLSEWAVAALAILPRGRGVYHCYGPHAPATVDNSVINNEKIITHESAPLVISCALPFRFTFHHANRPGQQQQNADFLSRMCGRRILMVSCAPEGVCVRERRADPPSRTLPPPLATWTRWPPGTRPTPSQPGLDWAAAGASGGRQTDQGGEPSGLGAGAGRPGWLRLACRIQASSAASPGSGGEVGATGDGSDRLASGASQGTTGSACRRQGTCWPASPQEGASRDFRESSAHRRAPAMRASRAPSRMTGRARRSGRKAEPARRGPFKECGRRR
uniref:Uncharacterized protein n=1 Tax=Sphaerodactylus townsendi TaxID=933632 RepID=A0ACB8FM87_9SAUR